MGDFLLDFVKLSIVEKECPVTEKETSKKTIYKIKDTMFLFWYRFVRPNYTNIQLGLGKIVYEKMLSLIYRIIWDMFLKEFVWNIYTKNRYF